MRTPKRPTKYLATLDGLHHPPRRARRPSRGITLLECILLTFIFSIVSLGAGIGLQSVSNAPGIIEIRLWNSQQIASKIESLRDTAYSSLVNGSSTSDADFKGVTFPITWTVTEIDPASPTANPPISKSNSGLKQVTVSMNGQSITTWVSQ